MPRNDKDPELDQGDGDPFASEVSPALQYVLARWNLELEGAPENAVLVIEGRVTELSASWTMKRGNYQSDSMTAQMKLEPKNLKCDLLVYHPEAEIIAAKGDLGVVAEVFRQFGNMMGREGQKVMVTHLANVYPEPEKEETRVAAGEGRDTASNQQSVEF